MPEALEDEDLLEMLDAGLLPVAVVDEHKARVWARALPGIRLRGNLVLRSGGEIAWVPGVATGERFRVAEGTRRRARLAWHPHGGPRP